MHHVSSAKPFQLSLLPELVGSVFMGFISLLCLHVHVVGPEDALDGETVWGHFYENYFTDFTFLDVFVFLLFALLWLVGFCLLGKCVDRLSPLLKSKPATDDDEKFLGNNAAICLCAATLIIVLAWLPYWLTWFPGGIYSDTNVVIQWVQNDIYRNQHTFFYLFLWKASFAASTMLGKGPFVAVFLMAALQIVVLAFSLSVSLVFLRRWKVRKSVRVVVLLVYCLVPVFPLSAISIWKDVLFSAFLLLFSLFYIDFFLSRAPKRSSVICFSVLIMLLAFSRNNGIYVVLLSVAVLLFAKRRAFLAKKTLAAIPIAAIAVCLLIQGPIYKICGLSTSIEENLGVPIQQMAAVVSYDGNLNNEQKAFIEEIMPLEDWVAQYRPFLVDAIKWHEGFDSRVISSNLGRFWKTYIEVGLQNPVIYVKAALLESVGFWDPFIGNDQNISCYQLDNWPSVSIITQQDMVDRIFHISLKPVLSPLIYPSSGIFAWILLICGTLVFSQSRRKSLGLSLMPSFTLWITLVVASPVAFSLRYFLIGVLMAPVFIILPFLAREQDEEQWSTKE